MGGNEILEYSTGIAAKLCDQPTAAMIKRAASQGVPPAWGPRPAVLYDLRVRCSFIASVMCAPPDPRCSGGPTELIEAVEHPTAICARRPTPRGMRARSVV